MKRLLPLLLFSQLVFASTEDSTPLLRVLPQDTAAAVIIGNAEALPARWKESLPGKMLADAAMADFLAPTKGDDSEAPWDEAMKSITGHTLAENLDLFSGPVVISLATPTAGAEKEYLNDGNFPLALVGSVAKNPDAFVAYTAKDLANTERTSETDYEEKTEDFLGVTLHLRWRTEDDGTTEEAEGWAIVDGIAVVAWPQERLRSIVRNLKAPTGDAELPKGLSAMAKRSGAAADLTLFVDHSKLAGQWRIMALETMADAFESNPVGLTIDTLFKALAPETIGTVGLSLFLDPSDTKMDFYIERTAAGGLPSVLGYGTGNLPTPPFVDATTMHVGTALFDIGATFDNCLALVRTAAPGIAPMLDMQLANMKTTLGVDLRADLIGGLDNRLIFLEDLRADAGTSSKTPGLELQSEVLYAFGLRNEQGVATALNALRTFLGQGLAAFEERELLGVKIHTYKMPIQSPPAAEADDENEHPNPVALPVEISHAITDGHLLVSIGSARPMEKAIQNLNTPPSSSLWAKPAVRQLLDQHQGTLSSLEVYDMGVMLPKLVSLIKKTAESAGDSEEEEDSPFNLSAIPGADVIGKYVSTSATLFYYDDSAIYSRTILSGASRD